MVSFVKKRKKPEEEAMRVGRIYRNVAKCFLEQYVSDFSEYEAILARSDLTEIESYEKVEDFFRVMALELRRELSEHGVKIPGDFAEVITYSEEPEYDLEEIIIEVKLRKFSETEKAVILLKVLRAIHDEWVRLNSDRFFSKNEQDKCKFLQFELLGPDEVKAYLIYVDETFAILGLMPCETEITRQYFRIQNAFLKKNNLFSRDNLVDYIMKADYNPLARDICDILRTDRALAEIMADN